MSTQNKILQRNKLIMSPHTNWEGGILFLVRSLLASALALASHFLVCIIPCDPVVVFLLNFHGYIIRT